MAASAPVAGHARLRRQRDLVPPAALEATTALVVGTGAVGRQAALALAQMGVPELVLVDFDHVEEANIATQGFAAAEVGRRKAPAVAASCRALAEGSTLRSCTPLVSRFERARDAGELPTATRGLVVVASVDSIGVRGEIFAHYRDGCGLFLDARMLGLSLRVLAAQRAPEDRAYYAGQLFPAAEAQRGACTAAGTGFTAQVAAGLLAAQLAAWLRGDPDPPRDVMVDLRNLECTRLDPERPTPAPGWAGE